MRESPASEGNIEQFASEVRNSYPVPFVVVGLIVLFLRIEDPIVWMLAFLFGSFVAVPSFSNKLSMAPAFLPFAMSYQSIFLSLLGPFFYFFFSVFPVHSPIDRRVPWLKWVSILLGLSFSVTWNSTGSNDASPSVLCNCRRSAVNTNHSYFTILFIFLGLVSLV